LRKATLRELKEMQLPQRLYQKQIGSAIATLPGHIFTANHPVANSFDLMDAHN
jgi:hypothetical protein